MSLLSLFELLEALPSSVALRESIYGYPILLTTHVVSMCLFAGLIAFWDMRLVGMTLKSVPVSAIQPNYFPWALAGFAISSISGLLLFYSSPMRFYGNFFFWAKNVLLILAGVNALVFHLTTYRSVDKWDSKSVTPFGARLAGILSLALWAGIILTGRMIAYNETSMNPMTWFTAN